MTRRHDVRRPRNNRTYTIREVAELMEVTITTAYKWVREGLPTIDTARPMLIHGSALAGFLAAKNKPRQPLGPGEIYCVACKKPQRPAFGRVAFAPRAPTSGDIIGCCPDCNRLMHRRVRCLELGEKIGDLDVTNEDGTSPFLSRRPPLHTAA